MNTVRMADPNEGIVEQYAQHLLKRASSAVLMLAVGGAIGGAAIGAIPGLLSHSVISPGANYFAVLLGAIAGGFLGRSLGEKRAVGLRLQAEMALQQLAFQSRFVSPPRVAVARPAAPAPVPATTPASVAQPAPVPVPVAQPAPVPAAQPAPAPPPVAPAPAPLAPPVAPPVAPPALVPEELPAPTVSMPLPPAPAPLLPAAPAPAPAAPPVIPAIRTEAVAVAQPMPQLGDLSAAPSLPPLTTPPLSS